MSKHFPVMQPDRARPMHQALAVDTKPESEAYMSPTTAGRLWGLDAGDWFVLLCGIVAVGLVALLV
jgi:hypothetical protein